MNIDCRYLLNKFFSLSRGIYIDELTNLDCGRLIYSEIMTDEYTNYVVLNPPRKDLAMRVRQIETLLAAKHRKPAIYLPEWVDQVKIGDSLIKEFQYARAFEDAWMVVKPDYVYEDRGKAKDIVHIGHDAGLLTTFEKVIKKAYSGEKSPDNPYGGISMDGFIAATTKGLLDLGLTNKIEVYLIKKGDQFVAAGVLTHDSEYGYVAGIGSIPEVRGQGFGKLATEYCVHRSKHLGCKVTFLATEVGSRNEEFYKRNGFSTVCTALCLVKD